MSQPPQDHATGDPAFGAQRSSRLPGPGRIKRPLVVVLTVLAFVAVGSGIILLTSDTDNNDRQRAGGDGGTDTSATAQEFAAAISAMWGTYRDRTIEGRPVDFGCIGAATVEVVGLTALREATSPEEINENLDEDLNDFGVELNEEQVGELGRLYQDCGDFMVMHDEGLREAATPEDMIACLRQFMTEEQAAYNSALAFVGSDEAIQAYSERTAATTPPCH